MILILARVHQSIYDKLSTEAVLFVMNTDDREDAIRTFKAELREPLEIILVRNYDKNQSVLLRERDLI